MKNTIKKTLAVVFALMFAFIGTVSAFALQGCTECGRLFEDSAAYAMHQKVCKPSETTNITYICSYCGKNYETKEKFQSHIESCALKPAIPQKGNSNTCGKCGVEFSDENDFNNHIQLCRDVYACSKCGKEFIKETVKNLHIIACTFKPEKVEIKLSIANNPGSVELKYGDILVVKAEAVNLPAGATLSWVANGDSVQISPSEDGETCRITAVGDGKSTVFVRLMNADGNPYKDLTGKEIYDSEVIDCDGGIFQKVISFFKNLFRVDRTITQ